MLVSEAVDLFLDWCTQNRKLTTARFYKQRLKQFREKLGHLPFSKINAVLLMPFLVLTDKGLSSTTRRHNRVALDTLQSRLRKLGVIKRRQWKRLEKPAAGKRERVPTEAETASLLRHGTPAFCRIYQCLRMCGARPGELCRATVEDWKRDEGFIVLKEHKTAGKTGKARRIPVAPAMADLLVQSLAGRTEGHLFLNDRGKPWQSDHLSRTYTRTRRRAGLPDGLVLYLARHEAGTVLCREHGILIASRVLGHSNLSTTQRYVHPDDQELRDACQKLGSLPSLPEAKPAETAPATESSGSIPTSS